MSKTNLILDVENDLTNQIPIVSHRIPQALASFFTKKSSFFHSRSLFFDFRTT